MAKPYGRLVYVKPNGMGFPEWETIKDFSAEIVATLLEIDSTGDAASQKTLKERAGVTAPKPPKQGYVISRAIALIRKELANKHNLIVDEKKKHVAKGKKIYRLFKREEVVGDVEHTADQLLSFDKENESIDLDSSLDADVEVILNRAIKSAQTYATWRDVRGFAINIIAATGAVKTDLGYIALPEIYSKLDDLSDIFEMMGLRFEHFKIAPEDEEKANKLIKDTLMAEFNAVFKEVDEAVTTLKKQKCIRNRLTNLAKVRSRVALYSGIFDDVQESLTERIEAAEASVNQRLGEFD